MPPSSSALAVGQGGTDLPDAWNVRDVRDAGRPAPMTRRLAWLNEKGGSGKSTSALNLAANLADRFDKRVLLLDLDHQANVTAVLTRGQLDSPTLAQVLLQ